MCDALLILTTHGLTLAAAITYAVDAASIAARELLLGARVGHLCVVNIHAVLIGAAHTIRIAGGAARAF